METMTVDEAEIRKIQKKAAIEAIERGEGVVFNVSIFGGILVSDRRLNVIDSVLQCDGYIIEGNQFGELKQ
jgi:hypothetical protein